MGGSGHWLLRNRWMMMVAGMWIMCCSGSSYLYSDYSESIKDALHYDQETLDTVGFFKELGESVGIISGLLFDIWPVWAVFLLGACQVSGGYLMAFLSVSGSLSPPPEWAMALFLCVGANGQSFFITAVLVSLVKRFPMSRGLVIGVMKGLVGLSAAVLTQFHHAIYPAGSKPQGSKVLLFLSWFPALVVLSSFVFFKDQPWHHNRTEGVGISPVEFDTKESLYLALIAGAALTLAAFLMGIILVQNTVTADFPPSVTRGVCFVTLLLLLLPLGIVFASRIDATRRSSNANSTLTHQEAGGLTQPLILAPPAAADECKTVSPAETETSSSESSSTFHSANSNLTRVDSFQRNFPARGEDHSVWQALHNGDFWLLVTIAGIGLGSGLTAMDNVGQVGASLGYSEATINSFVSLTSIWNFLGRLAAGALSESCLHQFGIPRPMFIMVALMALAMGHTIMALALPGAVYIGSVMIGLSFGAHWSLIPAATSELFGLKNFGTLLNAVTMASPVGSYILSVRLAGFIYDAEAQKQNPQKLHLGLQGLIHRSRGWMSTLSGYVLAPADENNKEFLTCKGAVCFRLTFFIMAGICVVGSCMSALLLARTRKYYTDVIFDSCQLKRHSSRVLTMTCDTEQPVAAHVTHSKRNNNTTHERSIEHHVQSFFFVY